MLSVGFLACLPAIASLGKRRSRHGVITVLAPVRIGLSDLAGTINHNKPPLLYSTLVRCKWLPTVLLDKSSPFPGSITGPYYVPGRPPLSRWQAFGRPDPIQRDPSVRRPNAIIHRFPKGLVTRRRISKHAVFLLSGRLRALPAACNLGKRRILHAPRSF